MKPIRIVTQTARIEVGKHADRIVEVETDVYDVYGYQGKAKVRLFLGQGDRVEFEDESP
jgi:hypothetical protein